MELRDLMAMPVEELPERLPAVLPESDQLARVVDANRQLTTGINQTVMRALSKQWGVAQKQSGKNRTKQEMRNDIARKIRYQANLLLRQAISSLWCRTNHSTGEFRGSASFGTLWC